MKGITVKLVNKQEREIRDNTQQQLELLRAILSELQAVRGLIEQKTSDNQNTN